MGLFSTKENRIRCGRCNTEFDLNINRAGCPLCNFGKEVFEVSQEIATLNKNRNKVEIEFLSKPPSLKLVSRKSIVNDETKVWGSWLMFNDFFAPKFLTRVLAWKLYLEKSDSILLKTLMKDSITLIKKYNLSDLKGFPNLKKDPEGTRLVHHFLKTFMNMGLIIAKPIDKKSRDVWKERWDKIKVSLTKDGLEFAQIENDIFDNNCSEQVLKKEEQNWIIRHLKKINQEGYKEYAILKEIYEFLKEGNNGNKDLWAWFEANKKFQEYILKRSERAKRDKKIFKKQVHNYARSFASAKISLLRELGIIRNKRNDYTIMGEIK